MNADVRSELNFLREDFEAIRQTTQGAASELAIWRRIGNTPNERIAREATTIALEQSLLPLSSSDWSDEDRSVFTGSLETRKSIWWTHPVTGDQMILIPPGCFLLGRNCRPMNLPGFSMARFPVTNLQFAEFVKASNYSPEDDQQYGAYLKHWTDDGPPVELHRHPVTWVNSEDATHYCGWYQSQLPTETQWEQASRGTDGRSYSWGNQDTFEVEQRATKPIGSLRQFRSPYGCEDMNGNVSHWCEPIGERPGWQRPPHPEQPVVGACYYRTSGRTAKATHRRWLNALRRNQWVGFRICV